MQTFNLVAGIMPMFISIIDCTMLQLMQKTTFNRPLNDTPKDVLLYDKKVNVIKTLLTSTNSKSRDQPS